MTRLLGALLAFLLIAGALYSAALVLLTTKPDRMFSGRTPANAGIDYERVTLTTRDGLAMIGWFIPRAGTPAGRSATVVVGHGYPYEKGQALAGSLFLHRDFNLFYYDLRYFGESQGSRTTFGFREKDDVAVVLDYLKAREDVDPQAIGMLGTSLSAGVFIQAHPAGISAMVLDSPFESLEKILEGMFPFLPGPLKMPWVWLTDGFGRWLLHIRIEQVSPLRDVAGICCPVLFIHGLADREIPPWNSRDLFRACPSPAKELWLVPNADHTEAYIKDPKAYEAKVGSFFRKYLKGNENIKDVER